MKRWVVVTYGIYPGAAALGRNTTQELGRRYFWWRWRARLYVFGINHTRLPAPVYAELLPEPVAWPQGVRRRG